MFTESAHFQSTLDSRFYGTCDSFCTWFNSEYVLSRKLRMVQCLSCVESHATVERPAQSAAASAAGGGAIMSCLMTPQRGKFVQRIIPISKIQSTLFTVFDSFVIIV